MATSSLIADRTNDAPLDHWGLSNTGLQVGDVIPGLIGIEYNAIHPAFSIPDGLVRLIHTQAPILAYIRWRFLLPDTSMGKTSTAGTRTPKRSSVAADTEYGL